MNFLKFICGLNGETHATITNNRWMRFRLFWRVFLVLLLEIKIFPTNKWHNYSSWLAFSHRVEFRWARNVKRFVNRFNFAGLRQLSSEPSWELFHCARLTANQHPRLDSRIVPFPCKWFFPFAIVPQTTFYFFFFPIKTHFRTIPIWG